MRSMLLVCLLALATSCETPKKKVRHDEAETAGPAQPPEFDQIADLEDRRTTADGKLTLWALTANDAQVRARALLALGRIQDPASADTVVKGLTDPDVGARTEAAFAVGLLGLSWQPLPDDARARLVEGLVAAEGEEQAGAPKLAMLEALGRFQTPAAVDRLTERLTGPTEVQVQAALSLGVAAKGGAVLGPKTITALGALLKKDAPQSVRYAGGYGLARSKVAAARPLLVACALDDYAEVRAVCAKGLGEVGTDTDAVTLKKLLDDSDYRVAAEAVGALSKLSMRCKSAACPALGALTDLSVRVDRLLKGDAVGGAQPLLALTQAELPPAGKALLTNLRAQLLAGVRDLSDARTRKDAANIDCRFAAAIDHQNGAIREVVNCGGGLVPEAQRLVTALQELGKGVSGDPLKAAQEVGTYVMHTDPRVKLAAVNALGELKSALAADKVRPHLLSEDPLVAAAAAGSLARLGDRGSIPQIRALLPKLASVPEAAPAVAEALETLGAKEAIGDLEEWLKSPHAAIRHAAAAALTKLKGALVVAPNVETQSGGTRPPPLPADQRVVFRTEKGDFEVKLFMKDARLTSFKFYTLVRKGFFKNITFHRVVPDFVVQGGDPRGDGEGGPGYTLRCEINHVPYTRGVVGMALSGKDTGGSQFFVTTSTQPHLDGRYTAFGEVTRGLETIDALLEGDLITDASTVP